MLTSNDAHMPTPSAGQHQDPLGLRGQELPPGLLGTARRWLDARSFEQQPHRARRDRVPKPAEFTVDAPIARGVPEVDGAGDQRVWLGVGLRYVRRLLAFVCEVPVVWSFVCWWRVVAECP